MSEESWRSARAWLTFRPWERHNLVLMVGGFAYILVGVMYISVDSLTVSQALSLEVALRVMELWKWGSLFVYAGLLAILSSRWPAFSKTWGYSILTGGAAGWSAVYALGFFFGNAPFAILTTSLLWGLTAFLWWAISGLHNPEEAVVLVVQNGDT
jgi:hypothetical protein